MDIAHWYDDDETVFDYIELPAGYYFPRSHSAKYVKRRNAGERKRPLLMDFNRERTCAIR